MQNDENSAEARRLKKDRERDERRRARLIEQLESEIEHLEDEIAEITEKMMLPENLADHQLLAELNTKMEEDNSILAEKYEEWEQLSQEK